MVVDQQRLQRRLGDGYRIFALPPDGEARKLGIVLPDGAMMSASLLPDQRPRPPFMGGPWMMTLLFAVISVTLLGLWAARAFDRAAVLVCEGCRKLQPERRRFPNAGRRKSASWRRRSTACVSGSPD